MSTPFEIIPKADLVWQGNQPYSKNFDDIYFSIDNGFLETEHVFINGNCLPQRWAALHNQNNAHFVIAETGFGTGLNFLITWYFWLQYAEPSATLYYYSCEQFPLSVSDLQRCLALWPQLETLVAQLISSYPVLTPGFHPLSFQDGHVNLILMLGDVSQSYKQLLVSGDNSIERDLRTFAVDAWFLDGFAPAKNEAMWSDEFFEIMGLLSSEQTTASTYSAAGLVRERLIKNGFAVERVTGFGQKKHMLTAEYKETSDIHHWRYCRYRLTPWHIAPKSKPVGERSAIVIGGGLAGCFTAHALAKRGWQVTIIEAKKQVGKGASGNSGAVLYPQFSAFRSPLTEFMLMAFLYAVRFYRPLVGQQFEGELNGILQFAATKRELASQINLKPWLDAYPELGRLVNGAHASDLAGLSLQEGGLFIPDAGWINSQSLCEFLINHPLITIKTNHSIEQLTHHQGVWELGGVEAETVIIANGNGASQFKETAWLPLKRVAGQMTFIKANDQSQSLKIPLCGNAHFVPAHHHTHALGSTFHIKTSCYEHPSSKNGANLEEGLRYPEFHQRHPERSEGSPESGTVLSSGDPSQVRNDVGLWEASSADDDLNIERLQQLPIDWDFAAEILGSWGGVRAATPDYLPLVGPVAIPESFYSNYAALGKDSRRFIPKIADHYLGLYLCTGFGSRGLTSIPLATEWLASQINQEPGIMPRSLLQALSPARFLRQAIVTANAIPLR